MIYFQIGNLAIPAIWLAAVTSLFSALILSKLIISRKSRDWFSTSFFLYFFTWKLSYIVFNLEMVIDMPLSIVYFNGGTNGHIMGLIILSIYLIVFAPRKFPSLHDEAPKLFLLYFISYEVINHFLEKDYIEAFIHLLILSSFVSLLIFIKKKENLLFPRLIILFILLELLVISIFQSIFSIESVTFIWIALTVLILSKKTKQEDRSFE